MSSSEQSHIHFEVNMIKVFSDNVSDSVVIIFIHDWLLSGQIYSLVYWWVDVQWYDLVMVIQFSMMV